MTGKLVGKAGGAGRKKKKKYEDSDSEWSDDARETQAPAKPGKYCFNSILPDHHIACIKQNAMIPGKMAVGGKN